MALTSLRSNTIVDPCGGRCRTFGLGTGISLATAMTLERSCKLGMTQTDSIHIPRDQSPVRLDNLDDPRIQLISMSYCSANILYDIGVKKRCGLLILRVTPPSAMHVANFVVSGPLR